MHTLKILVRKYVTLIPNYVMLLRSTIYPAASRPVRSPFHMKKIVSNTGLKVNQLFHGKIHHQQNAFNDSTMTSCAETNRPNVLPTQKVPLTHIKNT